MAEITSAQIKNLRETSGAGMMDCKKALVETNGDFEAAIDWLRKKGLSAAAKKSDRVAAEGLVGIAASGNKAALVELNSETDFVARNEKFQALVKQIAEAALTAGGDIEKLKNTKLSTGKTVAEGITENIATIGENMTLRRTASIEVANGIVSTYMHGAIAPNLGKIGVAVALESSAPKEKLETFGRQLAMHIAASRPEVLDTKDISAERLEREKSTLTEQAKTFEKKFRAFEDKIKAFESKLTGKRPFSEKQFEARIDELDQFAQTFESLEADYEKQLSSEDKKEKMNADKTKKLLDVFKQEAAFFLEKVRSYGDTNGIIKRLVDIKTAKFFEENALNEQLFVIDGKTKVSVVVEEASKEAGAPIKIAGFIRFTLGEGIEKEEQDFASEVAKVANG